MTEALGEPSGWILPLDPDPCWVQPDLAFCITWRVAVAVIWEQSYSGSFVG